MRRIYGEVEKQLSKIYRYVPYRLLSPFYEDFLRGKTDEKKNKIIEEKSQNDDKVFYKIYSIEKKIVINDECIKYIKENKNYIIEWNNS